MQRESEWRRVHIIGGAGSGKTTLARTLATHLNLPCYDLDEVSYEGGAGARQPLEARLAAICRITARSEWVTEGVYLWWLNELLEAADVIIWLDVPWRIATWRILKRHTLTTVARTNRYPGTRRLLRLLRWSWRYQRQHSAIVPADLTDDSACTRVATAQYLAPYAVKLLRNPSRAQIEACAWA